MDTYSFLDETRVGVWGWGYGGYVTAMVLGTQQTVFKCGIAVSPISDWLYYSKLYLDSHTLKLYIHACKSNTTYTTSQRTHVLQNNKTMVLAV